MLTLKGHSGIVQSIAFTPDGAWLASGSSDRTVRLWDSTTLNTRFEWKDLGVSDNCVKFSPDGRWLVAINKHGPFICNLETGDVAANLNDVIIATEELPATYAVADHVFSPDGKQLLAVGICRIKNHWQCWETGTWNKLPIPTITTKKLGYVRRMAFTANRKSLAMHGATGLLVCEPTSWQVRFLLPNIRNGNSVYVLAIAPDDRIVVYGSGTTLAVCELASQKVVAELKLDKKHFLDAAFDPSGRILATVSNEETVKCWDTTSWQVVQEFAWKIGKLKCIAFAPDGLRAAAGSDKGKIVIWDVD